MTTTAPAPLTARQREILAWIAKHIRERGYGPTSREGQAAFKFRSPNGYACHVRALHDKGYVTSVPGCSRTIRITEAGRHALAA